jgi:hypothetical protein
MAAAENKRRWERSGGTEGRPLGAALIVTSSVVVAVLSLWVLVVRPLAGQARGTDAQANSAGEPAATLREPELGDLAPDFTLRDMDGAQMRLSDFRGCMPVVIEFGSISCPITANRISALDEMAQQFEGQAQFVFIYGNEAHPGEGLRCSMSYGTFHMLPQVRDRSDRLEHARLFQQENHVNRSILIDEDGPDSAVARYGGLPHGVVVVDVEGRLCWKGTDAQLNGLAAALEREVRANAPSRERSPVPIRRPSAGTPALAPGSSRQLVSNPRMEKRLTGALASV